MMSNKTVKQLRGFLPKEMAKKLPKKIGVVFIDRETSRNLNKTYRKKDKPTNVLSFFYNPAYGEILICLDIVKKEAKMQGNAQLYQMTYMILHGMLHLAGVHHEKSSAAFRKFAKIEAGVLKKFFGR